MKLDDANKEQILIFMECAYRFNILRDKLCSQFHIAVMGTMNVGKSSFLENLGFQDAAPSATDHTTEIKSYQYQFSNLPCCKNFSFLDFPGNDDLYYKVGLYLKRYACLGDAFIFVVDAASSDSSNLLPALDRAKNLGRKVFLAFNKADEIVLKENSDGKKGFDPHKMKNMRRQILGVASANNAPERKYRTKDEIDEFKTRNLQKLFNTENSDPLKGYPNVTAEYTIFKPDTVRERDLDATKLKELGIWFAWDVLEEWLLPTLKSHNVVNTQQIQKLQETLDL
eukprot:m.149185 g.149185  ORF g.149185 m.149185 type:complete len:283 (-) comp15007_c2_seq5:978-1826(-)